ncbi:S8 family serine peptidase [Amycolatopsis sp. NPDC059657]|uniref:S53 family peptidase n=1 Tax=Amycolatopsis sp. NPDC059657 TaxID=3346899 RepID=UPI00366C2E62
MRRVLCAFFAVAAGLTAVAGTATAEPGQRVACPDDKPGYVRCLTSYTPAVRGLADVPSGWGATDLAAAYRLPAGGGADTLVAISIAYDAPNLESDLNTYRAQFGLPACTTANGCFRKVNQRGDATPLPAFQSGWAIESTLDVSMVSAACPSCRILVVEADNPSLENMAATEETAVRLGAKVVSNSYGARETGAALALSKSYTHAGATIVASSGDSGFTAASYPAVLSSVVAVGGTTLTRDEGTARGWSETVWQGSGSGCSAYVAKPRWQKDKNCGKRTVADVAAVAETLALYVTDVGGWITVDGTSASAPFVAGLYGRTGHLGKPGDLYGRTGFFDVVTGNNDPRFNGDKCGGDYLCVAKPGYDAPTGLGTPDGVAAF